MKKIASIILFSCIGGILTLTGYKVFFEKEPLVIEQVKEEQSSLVKTSYSKVASFENTDFTEAAEKTLNAVVHVKNTSFKTVRDPFAEFFYGYGSGTRKYSQIGTGSGVIISSDGHIITNNHVVKQATEIEVTLNDKKTYKAKLVGADASNDIALLKIEAKELPYIIFGDSDHIKVGEWVLAVGNPYNLTSTVTAGIISAKGRDLRGNVTNFGEKITDSFIQTDAAVNPGNSGGALVNTKGELIGINTAITSRTGSFIGYSFAVPSNIARKVVEDLMEYGNVQQATLGVTGAELNSKVAKELDVEQTEGFYISGVNPNSGAEKAGLKEKDIITKVDGVKVKSFADLKGFLNSKRPKDIITLTYLRDGELHTAKVTLLKNTIKKVNSLGLHLRDLTKQELKKQGINNGVKIVSISNKDLQYYYGVKSGYIITEINDKKVKTADDVSEILNNRKQGEALKMVMLNLKGEAERYVFR